MRLYCARKCSFKAFEKWGPTVCSWDAKESSTPSGRGRRRGWDCLGRETHTCVSALHLEHQRCSNSCQPPTYTAKHLLFWRTNINLKHENTYPLNITCFFQQVTFSWLISYFGETILLFNILTMLLATLKNIFISPLDIVTWMTVEPQWAKNFYNKGQKCTWEVRNKQTNKLFFNPVKVTIKIMVRKTVN